MELINHLLNKADFLSQILAQKSKEIAVPTRKNIYSQAYVSISFRMLSD
jgi:hypothetical protein